MAESGVEEAAKMTVENISESAVNGTTRIPATPEGMALAYGSLVIMALIPIFWGSFKSVTFQQKQKASGEKVDTMSSKDAAMFPIIASCALFGLYLVFTIFSKEYVNLLLTAYFFFLGILSMTHVLSPILSRHLPSSVPLEEYQLQLIRKVKKEAEKGERKDEKKESLIDFTFTTHDVIAVALCSVLGVWYLLKKHWIANNLLGLAFAINGVELLHLNTFQTGAMLLCGLFIYDIFWVFGTNVMVTVAKSFEAPIKLVFPQDLIEKGFEANNFAMLGLGDIVIPGILIALLLRFDISLKGKCNMYFNATFFAYFMGLLMTIGVMHVFKHAQPALLYLVPACLGAPLLVALIRGELKTMLRYEDHPVVEELEGEKKEK